MRQLNNAYLSRYQEHNGHRAVYELNEPSSGLKGFIAIHDLHLGYAVGGTRFFPYKNESEALIDVLRLSKAMTYKCALAHMPHGGAKGVIIADPHVSNKREILKAYAECVDKLQGLFHTGEDVGISEDDVQFMLKISPYFIGKTGYAGDPSPYAALTVFYSIKGAIRFLYGKDSLEGFSMAVKGVGKVGGELVNLLISEGAKVYIADINPKVIQKFVKNFPQIKVVDPNFIHMEDVDVYSPCALGNEFNQFNKTQVKARIICGGANNQLESEDIGDWFFRMGKTYVVDYIANSGGLINVADELEKGGYDATRVVDRARAVRDVVENVLSRSKKLGVPPNRIANQLAEEIFHHKIF